MFAKIRRNLKILKTKLLHQRKIKNGTERMGASQWVLRSASCWKGKAYVILKTTPALGDYE